MSAAYAEFASKGVDGGSITNLVKSLEIAKGSIYQYFGSKIDLHQYLIEHALESKKRLFIGNESISEGQDALFSANLLAAKFDLAFPQYAVMLYNQCLPDSLQYQEQISLSTEILSQTEIYMLPNVSLAAALYRSLQIGFFYYLVSNQNIPLREYLFTSEPIEIDNEVLIDEVAQLTDKTQKLIK